MLSRKSISCLFSLSLLFTAGGAWAQSPEPFPNRPVKWIVPYPVGGGMDAITRMVAAEVATKISQPVVVDNKVGASGTIGIAFGAKAPADGYNLLSIDGNAYATHSIFYRNLPYDPARDLRLVATFSRAPIVIAVPESSPIKTVQQLIDAARAKPGKLTFSSAGVGTPQHIGMEVFQARTQTKLLHVPYKAAVAMLTDLAGGQVDVSLSDYGTIKPFVQAGRVRLLAVATESRLSLIPEVPTFREIGVADFPISIWYAVAVPTATPSSATDRLARLIEEATQSASLKSQLNNFGAEPFFMAGRQLADFGVAQQQFWQGVVRPLNIKLD